MMKCLSNRLLFILLLIVFLFCGKNKGLAAEFDYDYDSLLFSQFATYVVERLSDSICGGEAEMTENAKRIDHGATQEVTLKRIRLFRDILVAEGSIKEMNSSLRLWRSSCKRGLFWMISGAETGANENGKSNGLEAACEKGMVPCPEANKTASINHAQMAVSSTFKLFAREYRRFFSQLTTPQSRKLLRLYRAARLTNSRSPRRSASLRHSSAPVKWGCNLSNRPTVSAVVATNE